MISRNAHVTGATRGPEVRRYLVGVLLMGVAWLAVFGSALAIRNASDLALRLSCADGSRVPETLRLSITNTPIVFGLPQEYALFEN
jgi:hypothetical protein